MRILLVTHNYPPFGFAGVEQMSEQAALALAASGHQVTVLTRRETPAPPLPQLQRTERNGISVLIFGGGSTAHGRFPRHAPRLERLFERTLLELQPDVVLISHMAGHSPMYVRLSHRWGVPVVIELHDFYVTCERAHLQRVSGDLCGGPDGGDACATHCFPGARAEERWALRTHMFRRALEQADALVCPSQFVAAYFRANVAIRAPLHVIGNGVRLTHSGDPSASDSRADGPLHVACIGAVVSHKGVHVALEALRLAQLPAARLSLFGGVTHPYFGQLDRAAADIPNLAFRAYGRFDPLELPSLLEDVDAVIIPSVVWETYSITTREAMACGKPVIASRLGALPEAVRDGENGLLFEPGSADELASILRTLDADRDLLKALGAAIQPTDWPSGFDRTRRLEAVLRQVLVDPPPEDGPELEELGILREGLLEDVGAI
jgi:glycosyltransferase involved in cell wall biosynthesis